MTDIPSMGQYDARSPLESTGDYFITSLLMVDGLPDWLWRLTPPIKRAMLFFAVP
jgi:hypothetical protein